MRELTTSPLNVEVDKIITQGEGYNPHMSMILYVGDAGTVVRPMRVLSLDLMRKYNTNYSDELIVSLMLPHGVYHKIILPNKDKIKAELLMGAVGSSDNRVMEYRAIPIDLTSSNMLSDTMALNTQHQGDLSNVESFKFQLKDEMMEELELVPVGGTWRTVTPADLLLSLLDGYTKEVAATKEGVAIGVTMQPPDNTEERNIINIEHGTPLVDVADILQSGHGGIYSTDMGVYFQKGMWYVWGLYDTAYESRAPKTLTVIMLPPNKMRMLERTYRVTPDQVFIYVTGNRNHVDLSDKRLMSEGNAVRYVDSRKQLESWREMEGELPFAARGSNTSEYVGVPKANQINKTQAAIATDNPFFLSSQMAGRDGSRLMVSWDNGNPEVIRPDMQVKVLYDDDDQVLEYKARLMELHQFIGTPTPGVLNNIYSNNVVLHLYLEPHYEIWTA